MNEHWNVHQLLNMCSVTWGKHLNMSAQPNFVIFQNYNISTFYQFSNFPEVSHDWKTSLWISWFFWFSRSIMQEVSSVQTWRTLLDEEWNVQLPLIQLSLKCLLNSSEWLLCPETLDSPVMSEPLCHHKPYQAPHNTGSCIKHATVYWHGWQILHCCSFLI